MNFILYTNNQEQGPYSIDELRAFVEQGAVSVDTMARESDSADWIKLSDLLNGPRNSQTNIPLTSINKAQELSQLSDYQSQEKNRESICVKIPNHERPFVVKFLNILAWLAVGIAVLMLLSGEAYAFAATFSSAITIRLISILLNYIDEAVFRLRNIELYSAISSLKKNN